MSDLYPSEERARAFGIVSAAIGVGLILGPSTIGYFGRTNFYIGLGIGLSCTFLALCGMYFVKESLHYLKEESEIIVEKPFVCAPYANPFRTIGVLFSTKNMYLSGLSIVYMFYCLAVTDIISTFVLYTQTRYGWTLLQIGLCDSVHGLFSCFNQAFMLRLYEKYLGWRRLLVCAFLVSTFSHLGYAFAFKWYLFVIAMCVSSVGFAAHPTIQALITGAEAPSKRGTVLGAMSAMGSLCSLAGGVANDNLFAFFISKKAPFKFPGPQFVLGSFLFLMAALAAVVVFRIYSESKVAQTVTIAIQAEKSKERSDSTSGDEQPDHFENQPLLLN